MLSNKAIKILADKIAPEIIEELAMSESFIQFLHQHITPLIDDRLGECDEDLMFDLALYVMDKVRLTTYD